jgi:hypothetical protein
MRKDRYHIEFDSLSRFHVERSSDRETWEDVAQDELDELLDQVPDERARNFLSVVRGGSMSLFGRYFYRIRPQS